MEQWKSYLSSRTIWANLVGFAALALNVLGFNGISSQGAVTAGWAFA